QDSLEVISAAHRRAPPHRLAELVGRAIVVRIHIVRDQFWTDIKKAVPRDEHIGNTARATELAQIAKMWSSERYGSPRLSAEPAEVVIDIPLGLPGLERTTRLEPAYRTQHAACLLTEIPARREVLIPGHDTRPRYREMVEMLCG